MVSDYFGSKQTVPGAKNLNDEKLSQIFQDRITNLVDYLHETVYEKIKIYDSDRVWMPKNAFIAIQDEWTAKNKVKIDPTDWNYLLLKAVKKIMEDRQVTYVSYSMQPGDVLLSVDYDCYWKE